MPESKSGALPLGDSPELLFRKIMQGMAAQSLRNKTAHVGWNLCQCESSPRLRGKFCKHACARPGHCRNARTIELPEPFKGTSNCRIKAADNRLKIVVSALDGKGRYFDWNRVSCQFLTDKNLGSGHVRGGHEHEIPGGRKINRPKLFAYPFGK